MITGAGGQLGRDLVIAAVAAGHEVAAFERSTLDLGSATDVAAAVDAVVPDVVINAGAWTAVDACESEPVRAFTLNGAAVGWLAEGCRRVGAHLVHVSTDYVFDGTLGRPYVETDETNPQSVYGRSKLVGEHEALTLGDAATVVRTSWVCGERGSNMVHTIARLVAEGRPLAFVDDQVGCPTFTADLAPLLVRLGAEGFAGVVHATNQGPLSWYEFAREVVARMGADPDAVRPIATSELDPPRPAPRPANSVLDNAVLRDSPFGVLRDFREPLAELLARLGH